MITQDSYPQVFLLLIENEKKIIPISSMAFTVCQTSKKKLKGYLNSIVLSKDGKIRRICRITRKGWYGSTSFKKITSALTGAFNIEVELKDVAIEFPRIKQMIAEFLKLDLESGDPFLPQTFPVSEIQKIIEPTESIPEIFDRLQIPSAENCLDVL